MENFREKLRSFLDTELNNLSNERCKETNTVLDHRTKLIERLTDNLIRNTCYVCDIQITKQLLKKLIKKNFGDENIGEDILRKITFAGTSLDYF